MDNNRIIEKYLAVKSNEVTQTNQRDIKPLEKVSSDAIMLGGIIGFILCWAAIFFMLSKRVRLARKEIAVSIKTSHSIPCENCKFYSNDPHLKCAVNPSIVLTEAAVDCSDYCTKENK